MSILSALKTFFFGPHVEAKPEQPVTPPPVVEQPPAPVVEVVAPVTEKKPRTPRKPKDDSWLKADIATKRPATKKPQNVVGKQAAKPAAKTPKKK